MNCENVLIQMSEWRGFHFVSCRVQHVGYCTYSSTPNIIIILAPKWKCHSLLPVIFFHCTLLLVQLYIVRYWYCTHFCKEKLCVHITWTEQFCTLTNTVHVLYWKKIILNMNCSGFVNLLIVCVVQNLYIQDKL